MSHILYSFRRCPYAMRARMALQLAGTEYEHREIILRDKPAAMLAASPKGSVPVFIRSDGTVLDESLDIMRWALPNLILDHEIVASIDGPFKHHLDRYKYRSRYDENAKRGDVDIEHRAQAVAALAPLELSLSGSSFLDGDKMGPNDMASFPFIRQFAAVEPEWWAETQDFTHLQKWLSACVSSELFKAIMVKHPLWTAEH